MKTYMSLTNLQIFVQLANIAKVANYSISAPLNLLAIDNMPFTKEATVDRDNSAR